VSAPSQVTTAIGAQLKGARVRRPGAKKVGAPQAL